MRSEKRIYALGFFDGVHLGHQALLTACRELADRNACAAAAITFEAHPQSLFSNHVPTLITTIHDRAALLRTCGMDHVHSFPVTKEVMSTPWEDFLEQLLQQGAIGFVCGHDFRFGHKGAGNAQKLRTFCNRRGIPCVIVPEQCLNGTRISSTLIRNLIEQGNMEAAAEFLGHPHVLTGSVTHGRKLGRTLGIPTANLLIPPGIVVPEFGVYACRALVDGSAYPAVANVGTRPTVSGSGITVEPWILDFEGDLYGKALTLEFHCFLRRETKFPDLAALQRQIHADAGQTRRYFERN